MVQLKDEERNNMCYMQNERRWSGKLVVRLKR